VTDPITTMILLLQVLVPLLIGTILFSSTLLTKWRWLVAILLIVLAIAPFAFSLVDELAHPPIGVNFGLGFAILFVWACSGMFVIIGVIRIYMKIKLQKP